MSSLRGLGILNLLIVHDCGSKITAEAGDCQGDVMICGCPGFSRAGFSRGFVGVWEFLWVSGNFCVGGIFQGICGCPGISGNFCAGISLGICGCPGISVRNPSGGGP